MSIFLALFLLTQTPAQDGCKDPQTAAVMCDITYKLFDESVSLDREVRKLKVDLNGCKEELQIRTSTVPTVVTLRETEIPWEAYLAGGSGIVLAFVFGFFLAK